MGLGSSGTLGPFLKARWTGQGDPREEVRPPAADLEQIVGRPAAERHPVEWELAESREAADVSLQREHDCVGADPRAPVRSQRSERACPAQEPLLEDALHQPEGAAHVVRRPDQALDLADEAGEGSIRGE